MVHMANCLPMFWPEGLLFWPTAPMVVRPFSRQFSRAAFRQSDALGKGADSCRGESHV
jgi:hypothetical protein